MRLKLGDTTGADKGNERRTDKIGMEATSGIEPEYTDLQSAA